MKTSEALKLLRPLAEGYDPITGELFSEDSPYQNANIVRAMYSAIRVLENELSGVKKKSKYANAGNPWKEEDDRKLVKLYDGGTTMQELSKMFNRSELSIRFRLAKFGKVPMPDNGYSKSQ